MQHIQQQRQQRLQREMSSGHLNPIPLSGQSHSEFLKQQNSAKANKKC